MFDRKMLSRLPKIFDARRVYVRIKSSVRANWILYVMVVAYVIVMSTITIMKNQTFLTSGFDLGLVNQAFSTTVFNHKLFYETADLSFNPGGSFFGVHFSPILFLLLPFYAIYPRVENLLVMQTVILALGVFPIYWMAREKFGKDVANGISAVYLLYPSLVLLNLNDFHTEAFTSTFFLFSIYYLEREKWPHFFTFMLLAFFTIEFAPIIGVFVALYAFVLYLQKRLVHRRKTQAYIAIAAVMSILFLIIALETKVYFNNYTSPISTTFQNILINPNDLPNEILIDLEGKLLYIISFIAPVAFLPTLAPELLMMTLPWIGLSFMSPYPFYHVIFYQYTGFVIPFVMIAVVKAIERLKLQDVRRIVPLLLMSTLICSVYLPLSTGSPWNYQLPVPNDRTQSTHRILTLIPSDASILTENDLFPHVSDRLNAYMYLPVNSPNISVKYIFVDITSGWYKWQPEISGEKISPKEFLNKSIERRDFGILAAANGVILLEKDYAGEPVLFDPYVLRYNYRNLTLSSASVVGDPTSTSGQVIFHGENKPDKTIWYGPYIDLPPGLYKITYMLKVDNSSEIDPSDQLLTVDVTASTGATKVAERRVSGKDTASSGKWFNFSLFFGLRMPIEKAEFRGYALGTQSVSLDYLIVEQLSPQPIETTFFNCENMLVKQGTVSEGIMVHSSGSGTFWYGPYTSLPKGNYTARFWLKLDQPYNGTLLDLGVSINAGKELLRTLTISDSNFTKIGKWQNFKLSFTLQNYAGNVEFSGLNVRQSAPLSFLMVEIYPDPSR